MINLIAAIAENNCIGINNSLPWNIPEDLKHFKEITSGKIVIMGLNTWKSLPEKFRPLPNRQNVIISDQSDYQVPDGVLMFNSIDKALDYFKDQEVFFIGGASIYRQTIDLSQKLFITHVHRIVDGDVFFPEISKEKWQEIERQDYPEFSFVTYLKK